MYVVQLAQLMPCLLSMSELELQCVQTGDPSSQVMAVEELILSMPIL